MCFPFLFVIFFFIIIIIIIIIIIGYDLYTGYLQLYIWNKPCL